MPLDLQSELDRRRADTDALLAQRQGGIDSGVNSSRDEINALRSKFFGGINPAIAQIGANVGVAPTGYGSQQAQTLLGREAERGLAQRKFGQNLDRLNVGYNLAGARNQQAEQERQAAMAYSRQLSSNQAQNEFQGSQADLDRQAGLQRQDAQEQFQRDQMALQQQYMPKVDYEGALMRSLFGLGTSAGTAYFLGRKNTPQQQAPVNQNTLMSQYWPQNSLTANSGFTRGY